MRVPGDKSGSHRALMLGALAAGESTIVGLSKGHDVTSTSTILCQLGAERYEDGDTVTIVGPEPGLVATQEPLDCGNSGTTMRLMAGIVSAIDGHHQLVGDESLSRRPMDRVAQPLELMGSRLNGGGERIHAPLSIEGTSRLRAITYHVPVASAQVKSAILLAGLRADGPIYVHEDVRTRSTTEDMLRRAGVEVRSIERHEGRSIELIPDRPLARAWRVPGDPSQAAFFAVLGLVHPNAFIEVLEVDASPERIGFIAVLQRMAGQIELLNSNARTTLVSRSSELVATEVHAHEIPSVDEVPILAVAAAAATGVCAFREMGELRLKESDRFEGAMNLARSLGCRVWAEGDDFFIEGLGSSERFLDFEVDAGLDHRIVMSSAIAGAAGNGCAISGVATVASSYPNFFEDLDALR
jgi:3-phosphoshikimate 1-carboxyvinyltransferase